MFIRNLEPTKLSLISILTLFFFFFSAGSEVSPEQDSLDGQMPSGRSMLVSIEPARNSSPGKTFSAEKSDGGEHSYKLVHIFQKMLRVRIVIRCNSVWRANQELVRIHKDAAHKELVELVAHHFSTFKSKYFFGFLLVLCSFNYVQMPDLLHLIILL